MRVLFFEPSLHGGGTERGVLRWADWLSTRGHECHVATFVDGPHDAHRFPSAGQNWVHHRLSLRGGHLGLTARLRGLVSRLSCDVLIPSLTYPNLVAVAALSGLRSRPALLLVEHNPPSALLRLQGRPGRAKLLALRGAYRRADAVAAVSHAAAADVAAAARLDSRRLFILPNPVTQCGRDLPVRPGLLNLVFVGRLEPQKRPDRLLDVCAHLMAQRVPVHVRFVGEGSLRPQLEARSRELPDAVTFLGWQEQWASEFTHLTNRCLVLPSDAEGFGNVLVEAAALGIPTVAPSQALGIGDAIIPGVTGVPALSARIHHLAEAVRWAAALDHADAGKANDCWLNWFSEHNSSRMLEQIVETVVAESGRR